MSSILVETVGVEPASKMDKNKSLRVYSLFSRINQGMKNLIIYPKSFLVIRTLIANLDTATIIAALRLAYLLYNNRQDGLLQRLNCGT